MPYFGYQRDQKGEYVGVVFDDDHVATKRMVGDLKWEITESEFKRPCWKALRTKHPPPKEQEGQNNAPLSQETADRSD